MKETFDLTWRMLYTAVGHMFGHWHVQLRVSKAKTLEVVFWVFTQVWVSVFRCLYTFTCPFTTQTNTHVLTHHWVWGLYPWWRTLSLFFFKGGGAAMVWNRPVFSQGQTLARPEGGRHPIPPQREVMVWDPFWTSTCWENFTLDTLFRPF